MIHTIPLLQQQAEATGCENGFPHAGGFFGVNASQGRCFGHWKRIEKTKIETITSPFFLIH
jgi:hypothetical protein